jgi:hypothetical protein
MSSGNHALASPTALCEGGMVWYYIDLLFNVFVMLGNICGGSASLSQEKRIFSILGKSKLPDRFFSYFLHI